MSVQAAGIPVVSTLSSLTASTLSSLAGIPLSTVLPVMVLAILSVWAAHCTPEASPVHEPAPEASPVHESAPEASPYESAPVPPEVAASTAEPPEVAASTAEPPEVATSTLAPLMAVAPTSELTVFPVMAKEAIQPLLTSVLSVPGPHGQGPPLLQCKLLCTCRAGPVLLHNAFCHNTSRKVARKCFVVFI